MYSTTSNRVILFGGRSSTTLNLNDVWVLTNANGMGGEPDWNNVTPSGNSPQVRSGHSAVYDQTNDRMIIFGGCGGYCEPVLNDVWVLINASGVSGTPSWIPLSPTGGPPAPRTRPVSVYDPNNNRMIVFAGQNGSGGGGEFSDPGSNRMTIFGGTSTGVAFRDVWTLVNANGIGSPSWIFLPTGSTPLAPNPITRGSHTAVYDPTNNIMMMFGGGYLDALSNGLWVLSDANGL